MLELDDRAAINAINDLVARRLSGWPASYPECLTHDAHLCRFLHGHGREPTKAAENMIAAVEVRAPGIGRHAVGVHMRSRTELD